MKTTFTDKELMVLHHAVVSSRRNGHDFGLVEDITRNLALTPQAAGGVLTSLQKKGVILSIEEPVRTSEAVWTQFILSPDYFYWPHTPKPAEPAPATAYLYILHDGQSISEFKAMTVEEAADMNDKASSATGGELWWAKACPLPMAPK